MDKLNISDDLKFGKQEILLDPTKVTTKCGAEVDPLLANDLMVRKNDGTYIPLLDFITQENLRIGTVEITSTGSITTISWNGEPIDVSIKINDVLYQPTEVGKWVGSLVEGTYEVTVKANADFRGITRSFTVAQAEEESVTITYNEE